jgi:hypothetical protein
MKPLIAGVLAIWFGLVFLLGANGAFVRPPGAPPFPILIGATVPLVVFVAAYLGWGAFRASVLAADLRLLTAIQAWRAGGLGFLALYAHGVLPGLFAWPAGLGDIAIGVTGTVGGACPDPPTHLCDQSFIRGLESPGDLGSHRRSGHWDAEFGVRRRPRGESHDGSDGTATSRAHTGVPRAVVHHAPSRRAISGAATRVVDGFRSAGLRGEGGTITCSVPVSS